MPIVRIDIEAGKSTAYKRSLLHGVRRAITTSLGVDDSRVHQRIMETPAEDIDTRIPNSDAFTVIEVVMLAGRGADLKERLYEEVIRELRISPGVQASEIVVYVVDPGAECFCLFGSVPHDGSSGPAEDDEDTTD